MVLNRPSFNPFISWEGVIQFVFQRKKLSVGHLYFMFFNEFLEKYNEIGRSLFIFCVDFVGCGRTSSCSPVSGVGVEIAFHYPCLNRCQFYNEREMIFFLFLARNNDSGI